MEIQCQQLMKQILTILKFELEYKPSSGGKRLQSSISFYMS